MTGAKAAIGTGADIPIPDYLQVKRIRALPEVRAAEAAEASARETWQRLLLEYVAACRAVRLAEEEFRNSADELAANAATDRWRERLAEQRDARRVLLQAESRYHRAEEHRGSLLARLELAAAAADGRDHTR